MSDRSERKCWVPAVTRMSSLLWKWANIPAWQCPVQCIMGCIGHVGSHIVNDDDRNTKIVVNKKPEREIHLLTKARNQNLEKMNLVRGSDPLIFRFQRVDQWSRPATSKKHSVFSYLECGVSAYTAEQFWTHKSLERHVQRTNRYHLDREIDG